MPDAVDSFTDKAKKGFMAGKLWLWYLLAIVVFLLDQWSKNAVQAALGYGESVVFTSFFNFTLHYNPGAAFSFLAGAGGWQRWFFTVVASVVSVGIVVWLARLDVRQKWEAFGLAMILGGAIGNLYDRISLGHVVDFIVVHYQDHYFPAFNLADSAICLGAGVLILDMLIKGNNDSG